MKIALILIFSIFSLSLSSQVKSTENEIIILFDLSSFDSNNNLATEKFISSKSQMFSDPIKLFQIQTSLNKCSTDSIFINNPNVIKFSTTWFRTFGDHRNCCMGGNIEDCEIWKIFYTAELKKNGVNKGEYLVEPEFDEFQIKWIIKMFDEKKSPSLRIKNQLCFENKFPFTANQEEVTFIENLKSEFGNNKITFSSYYNRCKNKFNNRDYTKLLITWHPTLFIVYFIDPSSNAILRKETFKKEKIDWNKIYLERKKKK